MAVAKLGNIKRTDKAKNEGVWRKSMKTDVCLRIKKTNLIGYVLRSVISKI